MASLQMIVRNAGTQVMNMMKADIAGKPLEHLRQLVKGTAAQRSHAVIPFVAALPMDFFELVLDIKQPHSGGTGHHDGN